MHTQIFNSSLSFSVPIRVPRNSGAHNFLSNPQGGRYYSSISLGYILVLTSVSLNLPNSLEKKKTYGATKYSFFFSSCFWGLSVERMGNNVKFHQVCPQRLVLVTGVTLFSTSILSVGRLHSHV